ncbi:serine/arginine-rich splicing factor 6-like [Corythoichthys intestinalis]|uniref:serine/arginine-rich splicing factor 6-like n=1 Tax=Corythoichthys intestinalis TaxID=161448 RepID=UPI0025A555AD|nr:serine/arginine-rich splicing factor 6-like [Corythoichthys intestinalis]XP_061803508.1 serine and arginine rich splicing factor 6b isoform X2 [Nerophis lumbriciformis]
MPRVYIGRLGYHVREKDVQRFFGSFGKLLEVDLKNGYGFVEFEDNRDADDAVYELNGKDLCGDRVIVEHARGPRRDRDSFGGGHWGDSRSGGYNSRSRPGRDKYGPPVRTEYRLIVENLSSRCSWQDLKDFMRQAGEVTYADAHKERTNEGVIEFRNQSDMKRAMDKLDGTDINGRKIRLVPDWPRRRRSYSGSRSRSRSRRRSRSRSRRSSRSRSRSKSRSGSPSNKRSKSGGSKSRSRNRKSHSRSKSKSPSRSPERKSKSRSKSHSKVKSERDSRSRSKEKADEKSRSRSGSPMENGNEERVAKSASRSPSPREDDRRSQSREGRSASRSRSRSRSRSASQD